VAATLTDALIAAAAGEIAKHRRYIDQCTDLRGVLIEIKINTETHMPRAVIFKPESENTLTRS
jgi:hypothetical protein